jgi:hypothetical protein
MVVMEILGTHSPAALLIVVLDDEGEQAAICLSFGLVPSTAHLVELPTVLCGFLVVYTVEVLWNYLSLPWFRWFFNKSKAFDEGPVLEACESRFLRLEHLVAARIDGMAMGDGSDGSI